MHMMMTNQRKLFKVSQSIRSRESKGGFLISRNVDVALTVASVSCLGGVCRNAGNFGRSHFDVLIDVVLYNSLSVPDLHSRLGSSSSRYKPKARRRKRIKRRLLFLRQ